MIAKLGYAPSIGAVTARNSPTGTYSGVNLTYRGVRPLWVRSSTNGGGSEPTRGWTVCGGRWSPAWWPVLGYSTATNMRWASRRWYPASNFRTVLRTYKQAEGENSTHEQHDSGRGFWFFQREKKQTKTTTFEKKVPRRIICGRIRLRRRRCYLHRTSQQTKFHILQPHLRMRLRPRLGPTPLASNGSGGRASDGPDAGYIDLSRELRQPTALSRAVAIARSLYRGGPANVARAVRRTYIHLFFPLG